MAIAVGPELFQKNDDLDGVNSQLRKNQPNVTNNIANVDTNVFGETVSRNIRSIFNRQATSILGGDRNQNFVRQNLGLVQSKLHEYGVDFPFVRDFINSFSDYTGINLNAPTVRPLPNIVLQTEVDGERYTFFMFESEEDITFTDTINWTDTEIMGRSSPVFSYRNSLATEFSVSGYLKVEEPDDIPTWERNMLNLKAMRFPVNSNLGVMSPPIWYLTVINPTNLGIVIGSLPVRVNSTSYSLVKPYLEGNVPTITRITLNLTQVEETLENSQASYKDYFTEETAKNKYFRNVGLKDSSTISDSNNPATDVVGSFLKDNFL